MPMVGRRGALLGLALAVAAVTRPAMAKDTLVIGVAQFPASLHPYIGAQTVQGFALGFALRRITAYDTEGKVACLLCTEVPSLQNGLAKLEDQPDGSKGLAVTIKLKPGLRWGDGVPVTARDILFTWKVGSDPNAGFANSHPWTRATSVDVVDDSTAVLHLARTFTSYALWDDLLSEHVDGPVYEAAKAPGDYINHTVYNRDPLNPGLWNGPFLVTDYRSNDSVGFQPNPYWSGAKPGLKRITLRLLENTASLQANLLSGDVDMTPSGIGLSIDQAVSLEKTDSDRFRFIYQPALSYEHIEPNLANPILQDVRVREALLRRRRREGHRGPAVRRPCRPGPHLHQRPGQPLRRGSAAVRLRPGAVARAAGAGGLAARPGRHPPQRRRRAAEPRILQHFRQSRPRVDGAGDAEPVEGGRHRGIDQEPAVPAPSSASC